MAEDKGEGWKFGFGWRAKWSFGGEDGGGWDRKRKWIWERMKSSLWERSSPSLDLSSCRTAFRFVKALPLLLGFEPLKTDAIACASSSSVSCNHLVFAALFPFECFPLSVSGIWPNGHSLHGGNFER